MRRPYGQYQVWPVYSTSLGCNCGGGLGTDPPPDQGGPVEKPAAPAVEKASASPAAMLLAAVVGVTIGVFLGSQR